MNMKLAGYEYGKELGGKNMIKYIRYKIFLIKKKLDHLITNYIKIS